MALLSASPSVAWLASTGELGVRCLCSGSSGGADIRPLRIWAISGLPQYPKSIRSPYRSARAAQRSNLVRAWTPISRIGRGGRFLGEPRLPISAIRGLSMSHARSAAKRPPIVALVTPTALQHTALETFEATRPNPGASFQPRTKKPLHGSDGCSVDSVIQDKQSCRHQFRWRMQGRSSR